MKKDVIITFAAQFFILITGILVYKFAAVFFGKTGFAEYALCRRTMVLILPAILLSLDVGISRYIAFSGSDPRVGKEDSYSIAGAVVLFFTMLVVFAALNLFSGKFAFIFFGKEEYANLIFPLSMMLAGIVLHTACYAHFRGNLQMFRANVLQIINLAVVPVAAFYLSESVAGVITMLGVMSLSISSLVFFSIIKGLKPEKKRIVPCAKELLSYGAQRIPGDFGMAVLLTLPATITAHIAGINEAGDVAFGISILNMSGAVFAPIGLVLLPRISRLLAEGDMEKINHYTVKILKLTLVLSLAGVLIFELFADELIHLYLGKNFTNTAFVARIIMAGAVAYAVYVSMRSIIDAYYTKAVNTLNIFISTLVFLILGCGAAFYARNYVYVTAGLTIALFVLGGLTMLEVKKIRDKKHAL